jgi:putative flavoprotein involved in K+ transport
MPVPRVSTVVIGAGQSGLAMSWHLSRRAIDHVVLERAQVAHSWRTGRWDSLRLLTPNWCNRLPGYRYEAGDPDGYMTMPEVVDYIGRYASTIGAPVRAGAEVTSVDLAGADGGFVVRTADEEWRATTVVLASGPYNRAHVPALADAVPAGVTSITAADYRNPDQLPAGGVLVVGAAATGVQLAHELQSTGRPVTLAVGSHVRLPRLYRGMDIMWWLDGAGVLAERYDEVDDIVRARHVASFQLVGSPERITVDLNELQRIGVRIVGRLGGITAEGVAQFSGSLLNHCTLADLKLNRLLDTLDEWAGASSVDGEVHASERFEPTRVPADPTLLVPLRSGEISTVLWATGYRSDYPWLNVPVLNAKGEVRHDGGVTPVPGLYLMGGPVLRRRNSSLIDGAGEDAADLSAHLAEHLDQVAHAH